MQRNTGNTESVTVEYGFLDSKGDDVSQLKNNWQTYAEAVVRAVTKYAGIPYQISGGNTYKVVSGDSLWGIAKKFNISVDDLKTANNLSSNLLSIGQILNIPETSENTNIITYTVQSGDTLYKIADRYNTTVSDIMKLNRLTSNLLSIGQKIIIPSTNDNVGNVYIVKNGDTLYGIASKYNVSVDDLKKINNITTNTLSIGQILNIPTTTSNTYTVQNGDTLYGIATKLNTTVSNLINKNNLTTTTLRVGQVLQI